MTINYRIFLITMSLTFVMVFLQNTVSQLMPKICIPYLLQQNCLESKVLVSPQQEENKAMDQILPKLEQKPNDYKIKQSFNFVTKALAGAEYDKASAYIVVDYDTAEVLSAKNPDQRLPMASITKVMTAMVALDLAKTDEIFTVSETAPKVIPTRLALTAGETFSLDELLHAALLTSANDCVQVIQEGIDQKYNSKVFIQAMNAKAKFIGLKNTRFTNPQGFDNPNHYSTVEDLAILSHYALENYPEIKQIVLKDHGLINATNFHTESYLNNWNGLIGVYPGAFGIKIGNTGKAGHTTAVAAERKGKRVLVVTLGAPGVLERDLWTAQLLDLGFQKLADLPEINVTESQLRAKYKTFKYFN